MQEERLRQALVVDGYFFHGYEPPLGPTVLEVVGPDYAPEARDVFIDDRLIRGHGPGDHFGELAARDWGGGYGYARLATVRCAEPGRLLKLTTEDLAWLTDSQPAVKARIAATLAERLQNR